MQYSAVTDRPPLSNRLAPWSRCPRRGSRCPRHGWSRGDYRPPVAPPADQADLQSLLDLYGVTSARRAELTALAEESR